MNANTEPAAQAAAPPVMALDRFLRWLSSIKVAIVLMVLLIGASTIGTLIPQHTLDEFGRFYANLTPSERALYGALGLFDVYHAWWFNAALLLFTLNLVLCTIDRLPASLNYLREPKVSATPGFAQSQPHHTAFSARWRTDIPNEIADLFKNFGWRARISTSNGFTTIFGERGVWSRWNFFVVHLSILLIIGAAFVGARWGYEGTMVLSPDQRATAITMAGSRLRGTPETLRPLPFTIVCDSIRVDLKDRNGSLMPLNVVNWYTDVTIKDGPLERKGTIAVNKPLDHKGYRFFQSGAGRAGDASRIVIGIRPEGSYDERVFTLNKNQTIDVAGIGQVKFARFRSDFSATAAQTEAATESYENPAAQLEITTTSGQKKNLWVFTGKMSDVLDQSEARQSMPGLRLEGFRFVLTDFDKVGFEHVLQVQYDPGVGAIYVGFGLLCLSLIVVFMFSHERVWAVVEQGESGAAVHIAAHTSRNEDRLAKRFNILANHIQPLLNGHSPVPSHQAAVSIQKT
jgi:cytochrome c biogenesis protein